jgi:uncharacterized membrane protein
VNRRAYIDWLRGLAVVVMMEWHSIDSWSVTTGRDSDAFARTAFIGGWAAPSFLYLAGVAVSLAGMARMRRGADRVAASWSLQKRGWQIFALAHVFRLQSFLFSPGASWTAILKPDILNVLGLGMVAAAWCWGRAETRRAQALWLLVPAAVVVLLTPYSRLWWWPTLLHVRFEAYIRPVGNFGVFQIFPSIAYVFIGAYIGALIATPRDAAEEPKFHAWLGAGAAAIVAAGFVGSRLPPLASTSEFWSTSISIVLLRTGAITAALVVAWLWLRRPTANRWSPLVLLGRTSLFVYWVHIFIAYGGISRPIQHQLSLGAAWIAFVLLTIVMTAAAWWWSRWKPPSWRSVLPSRPQSPAVPQP